MRKTWGARPLPMEVGQFTETATPRQRSLRPATIPEAVHECDCACVHRPYRRGQGALYV